MLHVQRLELQDTLQKLQTCMDLLEENRTWQDVQNLRVLMQRHQAVVKEGATSALYQTVLRNVILAMHICLCCCMRMVLSLGSTWVIQLMNHS